MIGNISKSSRFGGVTRYVLNKPRATLLGSNMGDRSPEILSDMFQQGRRLQRKTKTPCIHISLSLPHGSDLDDDDFLELAQDYLEGMGYDLSRHQYLVGRHSDRDHNHVHIAVNRIDMVTGKLVNDGWDHYRSQNILRQLEKDYDLEPTPSSWETPEKLQSPDINPLLQLLQDGIEDTLKVAKKRNVPASVGLLHEVLATQKIAITIHTKPDKKGFKETVQGVSYTYKKRQIPASSLGAKFTYRGLKKQGIQYQGLPDMEHIRRCRFQASQLTMSLPFFENSWRILQKLNTTSVTGTNYELVRGKIPDNPKGETFHVRHQDDKAPIITFRMLDVSRPDLIEFDLAECHLALTDTYRFMQASNQLAQWRYDLEMGRTKKTQKDCFKDFLAL